MSKIKNLIDRLRHGTLFEALQYRLKNKGIIISPYYWIQEGNGGILETKIDSQFKDYSFGFFDENKIKEIAASKSWEYSETELLNRLRNGKKCFGAKYQGKIAAFMWIDLSECNWEKINFSLKQNEAYLFEMFTMKEFRGKGIAPCLRYYSYKFLKDIGRDTFYSYSDFFNTPSINFKKKLNAKFLKLGLYIEIFRKYRWNWIIKNYNS